MKPTLDVLLEELRSLPHEEIDESIEARAIDAQRQLARAGDHRLPTVDLILAALADHRGLAVLHYDSDYELVRRLTDLSFESIWLAERGSL